MNMKTALRKLYKAISGEDNYKVNTSKLLVDIHKALTNKEPVNKNNHARIISELADNWTGGGGGSSDFSTATVTMVGEAVIKGPFYGFIGQDEDAVAFDTQIVGPYVEDNKFPIVLYKGKAFIKVLDETVASYSGNITFLGNNYFFVTGDCTITIS